MMAAELCRPGGHRSDPRTFRINRDPRHHEALEVLCGLGWHLPEAFRFPREDFNARGE
ncbi:hypothetical protein [Roseomonas sp. KE2513]|uniref:hypothetical protein n=1 Tax=Roseomonas sp. KE2513 TaxID=2479202 RepID=UPI0018DFFDE3|nr:hypothetical protein [Roseomonas sp. KE2513]